MEQAVAVITYLAINDVTEDCSVSPETCPVSRIMTLLILHIQTLHTQCLHQHLHRHQHAATQKPILSESTTVQLQCLKVPITIRFYIKAVCSKRNNKAWNLLL